MNYKSSSNAVTGCCGGGGCLNSTRRNCTALARATGAPREREAGVLLTDGRAVRSTLAPAYNKEGENSGDEEEDELNHNQPNNKSNQSTITILTTVDAMGSTDVDQSVTKWVLARVSVKVVSKQTSRSQISDEENEVEEGGNYLEGAIEEEDCEDGEGGEGNGEDGKHFRSDNLPWNPTETKVAELVHHIT